MAWFAPRRPSWTGVGGQGCCEGVEAAGSPKNVSYTSGERRDARVLPFVVTDRRTVLRIAENFPAPPIGLSSVEHMTPFNGRAPHEFQAIDWLFTHAATNRGFQGPSPTPGWQAATSSAESGDDSAPAETEPPAAVRDSADFRAASEWLQRERNRLQEYTQIQLARLEKEHQALLSRSYANEQGMILRCQELSRKEGLLKEHVQALQQQSAELSRREQTVASQLETWSRAQNELADLCMTRSHVAHDTEEMRALLATLRAETTALQQSRAATQAELEALSRALNEQREARAREQELARATQVQMEQRLRELDRAEQAAQRRVAELDELEVRLREEFEEQERQLAGQRREVAALYARLRQQLEEEGRGSHDMLEPANLGR